MLYVLVVLLSLTGLHPRTLSNFSETVPTKTVVLAHGSHLLVRSREDLYSAVLSGTNFSSKVPSLSLNHSDYIYIVTRYR